MTGHGTKSSPLAMDRFGAPFSEDEACYLQPSDLLLILFKHIGKERLALQLAAFAAQGNSSQALFFQSDLLLQ